MCIRDRLKTVEKYSQWLLLGCFVVLAMVWLPFVGKSVNGARRWIYLGPAGFQAVEMVKVFYIIWPVSYTHLDVYKRQRPQMAAIAERLADVVIVTDDNPRHENGDAIVADILAGFAQPAQVIVQRDRAAAITQALEHAGAGDVVLIAGKGHEPYQDVACMKHPFDDAQVARTLLRRRA